MAGIYIHIPFCKQLCYYCDFHFSVSLKNKTALLNALLEEVKLRKEYLKEEKIETVYFGGGTPSVLTISELNTLLNVVYQHYKIDKNPEITIEVNPDDVNTNYLKDLKKAGFNRLSIGVQSFDNKQLQIMNRRHNAEEAVFSVINSQKAGFDNISIDLIYGLPELTISEWLHNLDKAMNLQVQHISAYHLTIEPRTAFNKFLKNGKIKLLAEEESVKQFELLIDKTGANDFVHYEISNFGKPGYFSKHNTNYWKQKKYAGFGPSAHSYDIKTRQWNIANNKKYIDLILAEQPFFKKEVLSKTDKYNDYVLTSLRTMWGINLLKTEADFGMVFLTNCKKEAQKYLDAGQMELKNDHLLLTRKGKFIADKITSDLFLVE
ncbi:MAG: radical SAM family heme chaperone HemW [Chlorobi bacterium]|nr:radical SAM family heme chaperone HemW [Chlorobiota bacterium]